MATVPEHRRFVGPPLQWDIIGGIQFSLLVAAGLRENHRLLDVGCGSLRAGRFLIAYLAPDRYCGIEPEQRIVESGIEQELGASLAQIKRPRFAHRSDFDASEFGEAFDFALAQSIFTHTHRALTRVGLARIRESLGPAGVLLANYTPRRPFGPVIAQAPTESGGWVYPDTVKYSWNEITAMAESAGLSVRRIQWVHPRLQWFVAAHSETRAKEVAHRVPRSFQPLSRPERMYVDVLTRISESKTGLAQRAQRILLRPLARRPLGHPGRTFLLPPPDTDAGPNPR